MIRFERHSPCATTRPDTDNTIATNTPMSVVSRCTVSSRPVATRQTRRPEFGHAEHVDAKPNLLSECPPPDHAEARRDDVDWRDIRKNATMPANTTETASTNEIRRR